jgi:hypothetical protein
VIVEFRDAQANSTVIAPSLPEESKEERAGERRGKIEY